MKIAFFDPFSGASGDMILGALVDAGLSLNALTTELSKLDLSGYQIRAERAGQHGMHGTRVVVDVTEDVHSRTWSQIRELIDASHLDEPIRAAASAIFQRLANAEAKIHAATPDEVHFHEVGGVDAIVDICGACIGLALLGIEDVFCGPPQVGSGYAHSAHGIIPVPAPATGELLAEAGTRIAIPIPAMLDHPAELLTPTGAAILPTLATFRRPSFTPSAIGYGFGQKEPPWPNALRIWIGELDDEAGSDGEIVLETNLDDMNPQFVELVSARLFAAGALDVWITPVIMKKGRPGSVLSVLAPSEKRELLEDILIVNTSTLGVRSSRVDRTKAARSFETVATRWGDVRIKLRAWNGRVIDAAPEYADCLALAERHELPIREVWNEAHRMGEAFVGRRGAAKAERRA
ncbi:MAG: nickel pincer cofactor biosynthesis protein LarC [Chloroflexia bacterium]|nr:nickel pincer cofactor biosynthesis protein LarC [Chloroflexia bacterium]